MLCKNHPLFPTALAVPPSRRDDAAVYRFLSNASIAATWLGAELAVAWRSGDCESARSFLECRGAGVSCIPVPKRRQIPLLLATCDARHIDLFILPWEATVATCRTRGRRRVLLEKSRIPVLLLPMRTSLAVPPFRSLVVPMSGEARFSPALEAALTLSAAGKVPVEIIHVTEAAALGFAETGRHWVAADQLHHEYPRLIEAMIAQGSPFSTLDERASIRAFRHFFGLADEILVREIDEVEAPLVVAEWYGTLAEGRAGVLKALLRGRAVPLLLLRTERRRAAELRVGRAFGLSLHEPDSLRGP